ncbi:hypothetical protein V5O48_018288 [Marasmius crinis-equi]|uniref:Uncharacterized protein n=1 Tax=Marasmius crinis-equi TaxID=585013 RepID=A0ABR3ELQ5_9AGAR
MPSFGAISLYLLASLTVFTSAAPAPGKAGLVQGRNLQARCGECEAKEHPLPVLFGEMQTKVSPLCDKMKSLQNVTPDTLSPIVDEIKAVIEDAKGKVQLYIDEKVDMNLVLAADVNGGAVVDVSTLAGTFAGLINVIFEGCKAALTAAADGQIQASAKICADLCASLAGFIKVCCDLVTGLAAALAGKVSGYLALCAKLGVEASVDFLVSAGGNVAAGADAGAGAGVSGQGSMGSGAGLNVSADAGASADASASGSWDFSGLLGPLAGILNRVQNM